MALTLCIDWYTLVYYKLYPRCETSPLELHLLTLSQISHWGKIIVNVTLTDTHFFTVLRKCSWVKEKKWKTKFTSWPLTVSLLTLMSDHDRISPYYIYHVDEGWEWRKTLIIGLQIDPIPNSPNYHNENHLADSKENYYWDPGS